MRGTTAALLTAAALLAAFAAGHSFSSSASAQSGTTANSPRAITPRGPLHTEERSVIETFEATSPSVVFIDTVSEIRRRGFMNRTYTQRLEGTGSGFVWDGDGHIVTNHHVIDNASFITVTLASGETYEAKLVGQAEDEDLAVLRIEAPSDVLVPVAIGTSDDLRVGQRVLAIGNPYGLDQTLTVGTLSALGRTIESKRGDTIYDVIQTDAAINPGNSGGPLLDSAGRLIGVNTAIRSASGASAGIGFAVPVDRVNTIVPQLIEGRMGPLPSVGFTVYSSNYAKQRGVNRGVVVAEVFEGSGAERAGVRPSRFTRMRKDVFGDIVIGIAGERIDDLSDMVRALGSLKPGEQVPLTVLRDGETRTLNLKLDKPLKRRR